MIDMGVARPSAQGQAMIRTATATISAWASRGSGPTVAQTTNATTATTMTAGTNQAATRSAIRWIGCPGALGLGDHLHDPGQHRVPADLVGAHDQRPGLVEGAADDGVAGRSW